MRVPGAGAAAVTGTQILSWDLRSGNGQAFRNGTAIGNAAYTPAAISAGAIALGNITGGGANATAAVAEVVMVESPNDASRVQIERYLGARYGIAVS